jgi:AraC family transcriptional regulator, positive regulator of tynA and feaB
MSQLFSTELLPASDRIDAWQWNAQQICGDCRIQLPKSSFHGSIETRNLGGLRLTRFSSSALSFRKWPFETINSENRSCIVIAQIAGVRRYLQNGAEVLLKPGDSTVIDSGSPWSSSCNTDCVRLYLRVPRWIMENRLQMREVPIARRISGGTGAGMTLFQLSQSLYDEATWMEENESSTALDTYFEILAACLGGYEPSLQHSEELRRQILRFIEGHISESRLGPVEVASAMGISVRHLHRLLSVTGNTMGDYIRVRRLQRCREDLRNPQLREKTITEIAFSWGYSDAAHFSHSFKRQFGVSPRAFRAQAMEKGYGQGKHHERAEVSTLPYSSLN